MSYFVHPDVGIATFLCGKYCEPGGDNLVESMEMKIVFIVINVLKVKSCEHSLFSYPTTVPEIKASPLSIFHG
jgi:hypothetical protein